MMTTIQYDLQLTRRRLTWLAILLLLPLTLIWLAGYALNASAQASLVAETAVAFTVNSTDDTSVCDETSCTLRGAILAANSQPGADTIDFFLPENSMINLTAALPVINELLSIDGSAVSGLTVSGATAYRIFEIGSNTTAGLNQLILTQGGGNMLGGAILVNENGQLTVSNCSFEINTATNRGGAIHNDGGSVAVTESVFRENSAVNRGGAIYNDGGQLTISATTFNTNTTAASGDGGGAIYNSGSLILADTILDHNAVESTTGGGGAVFNDSGGQAIVTDSTFSANTAVNGGGAIRNTGSLTMTGCTVANNLASDSASAGGGLLNSSTGVALIANSTIYGNSAYMGGGIRNSALLTLINVTLSENSAAPGNGGGLFNTGIGTLNYTNSILANSLSGGDCRNDGTIAIRVQNLVESGVCDQDLMQDPVLGPLQNNGGLTWTQALLVGSPAVNRGDNLACAADPVNDVDQRGMARPQAGACDLGAYEVEAIAGLVASSDSPTDLGSPTTFTATVTAGESVIFEWAFGDGMNGTGATTNHTYLSAGNYTAVVTATNATNQLTATTEVVVGSIITGLTAQNDSPTLLGETTHFTATVASGIGVTYVWAFGDGQSGSGATTSHNYATVGSYSAVVTASNALGSATASTGVLVEEAIAGLAAENDGPTALGNSTQLSATVTAGSNVVYEWDFGDGQTGSGASPSHTYAAVGSYMAVVTATNALGSATAPTDVLVEETIAGLAVEHDTLTVVGEPVIFTATVTAGSNVVYEWDFGDGNTSTGATANHAYLESGQFTIVVTATNTISQQMLTTKIIVAKVLYRSYLPVIAKP